MPRADAFLSTEACDTGMGRVTEEILHNFFFMIEFQHLQM